MRFDEFCQAVRQALRSPGDEGQKVAAIADAADEYAAHMIEQHARTPAAALPRRRRERGEAS